MGAMRLTWRVAVWCCALLRNRQHHRDRRENLLAPQAFGKAQNGIYTKIFLHFERRFWDDADYVLFADPDPGKRGYYAVWYRSYRRTPLSPHLAPAPSLASSPRLSSAPSAFRVALC